MDFEDFEQVNSRSSPPSATEDSGRIYDDPTAVRPIDKLQSSVASTTGRAGPVKPPTMAEFPKQSSRARDYEQSGGSEHAAAVDPFGGDILRRLAAGLPAVGSAAAASNTTEVHFVSAAADSGSESSSSSSDEDVGVHESRVDNEGVRIANVSTCVCMAHTNLM